MLLQTSSTRLVMYWIVQPDVVLVHGDTSTTFVTACFYKQIPVGHVEAGLRTYDIYSPYPEEFNRQAVGIIFSVQFRSDRAFCNISKRKDKNTILSLVILLLMR